VLSVVIPYSLFHIRRAALGEGGLHDPRNVAQRGAMFFVWRAPLASARSAETADLLVHKLGATGRDVFAILGPDAHRPMTERFETAWNKKRIPARRARRAAPGIIDSAVY
jgi:hypothetical protein